MSRLYRVVPSLVFGRYVAGDAELTSGDCIAFLDGNSILQGRVEHDSTCGGYFVRCMGSDDQRVPLSEIVFARYVSSGRW